MEDNKPLTPEEQAELDQLRSENSSNDLTPAEMQELEMLRNETEINKKEEDITPIASAARGFAQGMTLGFADEIAAATSAGVQSLKETAGLADEDGQSLSETFSKELEVSRANFNKAETANPGSFTAGEITGGFTSLFIPGGAIAKGGLAAKAGAAAVSGAISSIGYSENKFSEEALVDAATSAATGAALSGLVSGAGKAIQKLSPDAEAVWGKMFSGTKSKQKALNKYLDRTGQDQNEFFKNMTSYKVNGKRIVEHMDSLEDINFKAKSALTGAGTIKDALLDKANVQLTENEARSIFASAKSSLQRQLQESYVPKEQKLIQGILGEIEGTEANLITKPIARALELKSEVMPTFSLKDLYRGGQQLQKMAYLSDTDTISSQALRKASKSILGSIDDTIHTKGITGNLDVNLAEDFKKARLLESNLIKFNEATQNVADDLRNKKFSPFKALFTGSLLAGGLNYAGLPPEQAIGIAVGVRSLSSLPRVNVEASLIMSKLGNLIQQGGPTAARITQSLAGAANNSSEAFEQAAMSEYSKVVLAQDPIQRNTTDVINKMDKILAVAKYEAPELHGQIESLLNSGESDSIGPLMDQLSKAPGMKQVFGQGIGFDGKVYTPEDQDVVMKRLVAQKNAGVISHVQYLQHKSALMSDGIIPQTKQEPDVFLQYQARNKKKSSY